MEKLRAFIAISPPPPWIEALTKLLIELKSAVLSNSVRWVNPAQIHVTLRFFGWISEQEGQNAIARLLEVRQPAFELRGGRLGCFPNAKRPRVLWIGLEGDVSALTQLHDDIRRRTATIGDKPEDRPFTAHLTLARIKEISRNDKEALEAVLSRPIHLEPPWRVDKVELMRSHLSPSGARYVTLAVQSLSIPEL